MQPGLAPPPPTTTTTSKPFLPFCVLLQVLPVRTGAEKLSGCLEQPLLHLGRPAAWEFWPPHHRPYPSAVRMLNLQRETGNFPTVKYGHVFVGDYFSL